MYKEKSNKSHLPDRFVAIIVLYSLQKVLKIPPTTRRIVMNREEGPIHAK